MLVSVSIAVAVHVPTSIVIATFPVGTNPTTSIQGGGCVCIGDAGVNGGQTFTIVDIEGFTGTSISTAPGGAFQTQLLANTITIATNQWVAIVFMDTSSGAPHFIVDQCDNTCGGPPAPAGYAGLQLNFGTPNPSIGGTGTSAFGFGPIVGGTFQPLTQITPGSGLTQCYGNCGSPAITLANTNSTKSINFNQSITLLYVFQSNLNGVILNLTTNLAIATNSNQYQYYCALTIHNGYDALDHLIFGAIHHMHM